MEIASPVRQEQPPECCGLLHRFARSDVEAEYRRWRIEHALPFTRVGMYASLLGWLTFMGAALFIGAQLWRLAVPATLLIAVPIVLGVLATTFVASLRRWMLHASAVGNLTAGLLLVVVLDRGGATLDGSFADVASAATVIVVYYGCTILRLPPTFAAVAILPYVLLQQRYLLEAGLPSASTVGFSALLWLAVVSGLLLSVVLERVWRDTFRQERVIAEQQGVIEAERERAERLLHSILPAQIAERLKVRPGTHAQSYDEATVLFADVVGFTELSSTMSATRLVELLNTLFSRFDALTARHGVEKIKTIGDAYMAVAGVPEPRGDHAQACADLALAMRETVRAFEVEAGRPLDFRIGMHTGPVVAGVIGTTKFAYDLWGDTVNVAARMESHGLAGQIQVTEGLAARLRAAGYVLRERGPVEVKGKGTVTTWLLDAGPTDALTAARTDVLELGSA